MRASREKRGGRPAAKKNDNQRKRPFTRYMRGKLAFTAGIVALLLFILMIRLQAIGRENNEEYQKIVYSQQDYESRTIAFRRGDILDRNGTVLATTTKLYNLILDPYIMTHTDDGEYAEATLNALAECYGYDINDLTERVYANTESRYVIYARELTEEQMNSFLDKEAEVAEEGGRVVGVWFETKYKRIYPYDDLACWILGFSRDDSSSGSYGIEQYYNDELVGINGREYGYLNDDTNLERVIKPAENGNTIVTTIDVTIQQIVQEKIAEAQEELQAENIGVIVMDPDNGEILAMAGDAVFDCNNPSDTSALLARYTQEEIDAMSQDELTTALAELWRNFCISYTYEPGSTAKVFTVTAALEEARVTLSDTFDCDGIEYVGGWPIHCNDVHGHQTLTETLMNSCNDALMNIAARLGAEEILRYQSIFGFGSQTGVDLPGEESGLLQTMDTMDVSAVATNGFGQNYNITMIQQIAAYCSVVNGGTYYEPHVVRQIKNSDGALVEEVKPVEVRETVSADTSEYLKEALFDVVDIGTGGNARIPGYEVGGKTGTAEKQPRDKENYLLSFIGGVPASDPEVVLYVVVDAPAGVENQAQSRHASNVWKAIMQEILPYLNIYPTREVEETEAETAAEEVPAEPETDADGNPVETEAETEPETANNVTDDSYENGIFGSPGEEPQESESESQEESSQAEQ